MIRLNYEQSGHAHYMECDHAAKDFAISLISEVQNNSIVIRCDVLKDISLQSLEVTDMINQGFDHVQTNGYQSWTDSDIVTAEETYKAANPLFNYFFKSYGDYGFTKTEGIKGHFNSYSYVLLKKGGECFGLHSRNEDIGFTIFKVDIPSQKVKIIKDIEGKKLYAGHTYELMHIDMSQGNEASVVKSLFVAKPYNKISGWTSWYNYYTNINYDILKENLDNIIEAKLPYEVFQIDDGYQTAVGDWLSLKGSFENDNGLKKLVDSTHVANMKAGLWLAPFVAEKKSKLYIEHKEWFVKGGHKYQKAGWNPGWSGNFYTLDIYNKDVIKYLKKVFDHVKNIWGFDFVKLDFLYAIAIMPYNNKSRGEIMSDGAKLLRTLCGDMEILGCGVPLASCENIFDYCRIGSDVGPYFEDSKLKKLHYRERVSTYNSLKSTIGRSMLNGSYFVNDPDVFIYRDEGNKMNTYQRKSLFVLNNLLGGLVFTSDNIGTYTDDQLAYIRTMYPMQKVEVMSLSKYGDRHHIVIKSNEMTYDVIANLSDKAESIAVDHFVFDAANLKVSNTIKVEAFETRVVTRIDGDGIIYSDNHVLPGANVESLAPESEKAVIVKEGGVQPTSVIILSSIEITDAKLITMYEDKYIYELL